jgi:SulP family sulfate permease
LSRDASLRADLVAGITLAAYLLPAGIADASLAGLPPEACLYACLFGGLVFWAFCSSRHTAVTVTSAISLLVGTSIGELSNGDAALHAALSMAAALLVGVFAVAAWAARAGVIVNFVSESVLIGFKCGIAFVLASTQLPKLLGFAGGHGSFWERLAHIARHVGETHPVSLALGLTALAVLVAGKKVLGEVPQGLPALGFPALTITEVNGIVPIAVACFLLAAVESAAIGRMFALKHGYRFDPNRELLALGASNLAAGFGRGFPISGGMSQSLVNESAGARSSRSGLIAAVLLLVIVVWFSGLLRDLPQPVLAAIVLAAVTGLIKVKALRRLWVFNRAEFTVAAVAFLGVLGQGILRGIFLGVILSLLMLLRRASHPNVAELGHVGNDEVFGQLADDERRRPVAGAFVARVDGALLYFNAERVRDRLIELFDAREGATVMVLFLGSVPAVDLAGADMLIDLHHAMRARGIDVRFAGPHARVRGALARAGMSEAHLNAYRTIPDALAGVTASGATASPP